MQRYLFYSQTNHTQYEEADFDHGRPAIAQGDYVTTKSLPYQLHLFTLRLWQETLDGKQWEWRGEVKNTGTGEVRYFRDWHMLVHLLPALLAETNEHEVADEHNTKDTDGDAGGDADENKCSPSR